MNINKELLTRILIGVGGAGAGGAGTFFITKKRLQSKIRAEADAEIESVKATFKQMPQNSLKNITPEEAVKALVEDIEEKQEAYEEAKEVLVEAEYDAGIIPQTQADTVEAVQSIDRNVFTQYGDKPVVRHEPFETVPLKDQPYVISLLEYMENEEYSKVSFEYYGDGTLVNEAEEVVEAADTIGVTALERFGEGSQDEDVVYVRDPNIEVDYEVTRNSLSWAEVRHGITPEG